MSNQRILGKRTHSDFLTTYDSSNIVSEEWSAELILTTSETLDEFDDQENLPAMILDEETEDI